MAAGWAQANLVVLPRRYADDFERFCRLNPGPCPLLDVTEPGSPEPKKVAPGADLRVDLPRYRCFRFGTLESEVTDLSALWRPDLVGFLLGCSYTFDAALRAAGFRLPHEEAGQVVPTYRTDRLCAPSGAFQGPLVVTMRPIPRHRVAEAVALTGRYVRAHGAPVHVGDPAGLGIRDLNRPDWGEPVGIADDEVPAFWACGVTPQAAIETAGVDLVLTHAPGHMFITDLRQDDLCKEGGESQWTNI